jgi:hypothetical protein
MRTGGRENKLREGAAESVQVETYQSGSAAAGLA